LFYLVGDVVDNLPCIILNSATKRLKENNLVVTQPNNIFGKYFFVLFKIDFDNSNTTVQKSNNNNLIKVTDIAQSSYTPLFLLAQRRRCGSYDGE